MPDNGVELGELSSDTEFINKVESFRNNLENIGKIVEVMSSQDAYDKMSMEEKVQYDLFLSFSINSLFWMYLKTQGIEPSSHGIKSEISRVRQYMSRSTQIHERRTIMPHIDQDAAKRFIRSGLWDPKNRTNKDNTDTSDDSSQVNSNKRKREDSR